VRQAFEALATAGWLLLLLAAASGLRLLLLLPAIKGPLKWRRFAQSAYLQGKRRGNSSSRQNNRLREQLLQLLHYQATQLFLQEHSQACR
jgi:hypothetical protein